MTNERIQAYTARIAVASKSELVVIMYEVIIDDIEEACIAFKSRDMSSYQKELKHAGRFLNHLMANLDYRYEISYNLMSLYIYVNKLLINASFQKNIDELINAKSILTTLLVGFEGVSKEDSSGPVMQNSQQIYAGFTYGKGTLNEVYIDAREQSRGYKA